MAVATQPKTLTRDATLGIPDRQKGRWLKGILRFTDTEMAYVLGISVETLRKCLKDETDTQALDSVRFDRLLNLTRLARGVIRPERLGH